MTDAKGLLGALLAVQQTGDPHGEAVALRELVLATDYKPDYSGGRSALDRFLSRVAFGMSDCWVWIGALNHLGYGVVGRRLVGEHFAHRASYRLFHGTIPDGLSVMHSCDVRCCVSPEHLSLGTQAENNRDMVRKGRRRGGDVSGERNGMARLTADQVASIRRLKSEGVAQVDLAREFGVSPMCVSRIVRRETWQ